MRFTTRNILLPLLGALVIGIAACGGSDDDGDRVVLTPLPDGVLLPIVISSDLAIGENRFLIGLQVQETGELVLDADLDFAFFLLDSDEGTLKFERDPEPIVITRSYTHTHEDGLVETHEAGEVGAYRTTADFDVAGPWGVEVTGTTADGQTLEPLRPTFSVNEEPFGLAVGDPAPLTEQVLVSDVDDIREIDSSENPIAEQHNMTVADAVTSGLPTVIAIATPAFCETEICGPTKVFFDDLYNEYSDVANFVHVEPYQVQAVRDGKCATLFECRNPIIDEWRLQSEPWVFIVDADGNIAAKFDGMVTFDEMADALEELIA
ncbi:MAG: hypothetical protein IIA90_06690 [Chloroflexi bacterium]|nr:hypothetical protein [Chloroflexota bacterium]